MKKLYLLLLLCCASILSHGQITASSYGFTPLSGTFSSISSTGTVASSVVGDDVTQTDIPIGFTFNFCGNDYTTLSACANGWLSLSNIYSTTTYYSSGSLAGITPAALFPFWRDLDGRGTGSQAYYTVTGTAPNRVFTFEWSDWRYYWYVDYSSSFSVQVKLYETTNQIDFVYSNPDGVALSSWSSGGSIGIANSSTDYLSLDGYGSSPSASFTTFTSNLMQIPATGQIYRFTPPPPCSTIVEAGVAHASVGTSCPSLVFSVSLTGTTAATGFSYQWQSSTDSISWLDVSGATSPTSSVTATTNTYFRCIVTCPSGSIADTSVPVLVPYLPVCYCITPDWYGASSLASGYGMNEFTMSGYSGSSLSDAGIISASNPSNGYLDRMGSIPTLDLQQGNTYSGTVTYGTYTNYMETQAWIDFNDDGVFSPSEVVSPVSGFSTSTYDISAPMNISIPMTAATGLHRMRVRCAWLQIASYSGSISNPMDPCTMCDAEVCYWSGTVTDYKVNIIPIPPCSGTPTAGVVSGVANVCPSTTFTLSSSGYTIAGSLNFQWQSSTDSLTWTNISGATSTSYSGTETATTYYRCYVTCTVSGLADTSAGWRVFYRPICPCIPSYSTWYSTPTYAMNHYTVSGYSGTSIDDSPSPLGATGYNDRTSISVNFMQGNTYSGSIGYTGSYWYPYNTKIWIDFNDNGVFESSEAVSGAITEPAYSYGPTSYSLNIPLTATVGTHLMRVRNANGWGVSTVDPCSGFDPSTFNEYAYGSTFDYTVNIIPIPPCSGTPSAGTISGNTNICPSTTFTLTSTGYTVAGSLTFQWQISNDSATWVNIAGATSTTYSGTESSSNYYRLVVNCTVSGESDTTAGWEIEYRPICPCIPEYYGYVMWGDAASYYAMNHFTVSGYSGSSIDDSPSPLTASGYIDRTTLSVDFMQGNSYSGSIGYNGSYWNPYSTQIWIDFNDNGTFEASEAVSPVITEPSYSYGPTSYSLSIPLTATLGTHVMRVRNVAGYGVVSVDPCAYSDPLSGSSYYYGSTFDYFVNIVPIPPCTGTPEAGTVSGTANVCPSATFTLAASGYSIAGSLSFQWQSSTDSLTWTNITGAVGLSYSGTETATTYYRCMVTCIPSGISDSTNGWKVVYRSICPCVPTYMTGWSSITSYAMNHFDVTGSSSTSIDDSPSPLAPSGYMDRTPMSVSFVQGNTYTGNIGYTSMWSDYTTQIWIDYNDNGIFESSESTSGIISTSFGSTSSSFAINVSLFAPVGTHVMRVRNVGSSIAEGVDPCLEYGTFDYYYNGSTFDYYVNIVAAPPCSGTPTAGNIVGSTSACPSSDVVLGLSGSTAASSLTFQWYSSSDSITWTPIAGATVNTLSTTTSASTYYSCVVGCLLSGQSDTTNAYFVTYTSGCYCVPSYGSTYSCSWGYAISFYGFSGEMGTSISDMTSCDGTGYKDNTSMSATVFQGNTYSVSISNSSYSTTSCQVWIDFNDNGTFESSESVGGSSSYYLSGTFDINIPSGATVGNHRMRVVTGDYWDFVGSYPSLDPCPSPSLGYYYGEARDYTINVMPPSCYGVPTAGTVSATVTEACVGYSSNLTVSGYTDLAGISFQWQSSTDSVTWTDIIGATTTGITVTPTTSTYYRVRVHCMYGAADDYTAGVHLIVNPYPAAITGSLAICNGTTTTLSTTSTGGTWTSSNPSVANIDAAGNVSALWAGTSTISYTFATGCGVAQVFTVNPNPLPISGPAYTCLNVPFTTFSTESSIGTWSISSEAIATISATGNVYPVSIGTATITYSYSTGCFATTTTTVSPYPAEITGLNVMCGTTATALMSTTSSGGAWSSSAPGVVSINTLGLASAASEGSAVISYTYPVTGCNTTHTIDVTATPAPITGPSDACIGAGTALSCASLYGTWSSASTAVAVVNPTTGVVTGVSEGTTLITYTLPGGCISSRSIHVNPLPAPIVGSDNLCVGLSGLYTDATSGGVWTVTPASVAGVSSFGILSGVGAGTATLSYTNPVTGCRVTKNVAVNNIVAAGINVTSTAPSVLCAGTSVTYNAAAINGGTAPIFVWSVNGTILSSGASYTYTPADGDVVKCKVTSNQVCAIPDTASQSMTMNVHPVGAASVSISTGMGDTVCTGALVAFTPTIAMGGTTPTYQWTVNYVPVSTSAIFAYLPSNGDIVQLTILSSDVCATSTTASTTHVITVSPYLTPAVTLESSATGAICMGTPAVLTATPINGGFNPEYIWLVNGSVTGETSNTYGYIPANGDVVQVNMSSSFPCVVTPDATNTMVMTVVEGGGAVGYISASPSTSVTPGTNVHFTANMVSGTSSTTTYQWYVNGIPVPGATATTFNSTTLHTGDSVTCVVTNVAPCAGITVLNAVGMVVEWPSNINNVEFNPQVLMLPNPTRGAFTVKGQIAATADENVTLEVTDMLGVVIYREAVVAKKGILDHAVTLNGTTANGMYILNVKSKNYSKVINFVLEQ